MAPRTETNEPFSLPRSNALPLSFQGQLLGTGEIGGKFWTRVQIFRTVAGKYIAHVTHGSDHADNQGHAVAHVVSDAPGLLTVLRDRKGKVGGASLGALAQAAAADAGIRDSVTERIE